ncbi:DNA mismatch repair protein MutS [Candidatus Lokiarchaeum ossiferum]|uniref:DNA mismatch repair protein MutS n=1 Tax=Candidatus Lokiarchaeum ossiferum TaxID=2951803 RepID=UPI00352CDC25
MPEMTKHWYSIRKQYPDNYLLAYRMGDFYEFFYDDAVNVSKYLGLTLTKRGSGPSRHPLAGIPHKATQHFKTLVGQGQTVIIVEQLESPAEAKKAKRIVKRGVVRILTPGTIIDNDLLESKSSNYICTIYREKKNYGVAFLDLSSADFFTSEFFGKNAIRALWSNIARYSPVECILSSELLADFPFMAELRENTSMIIKEHGPYHFNYSTARDLLLKQFKVQNLTGYGIDDKKLSICAAGGLLSFIKDAQKRESLDNLKRIKYLQDEDYMFLDINSQKNLELLHNQSDGGSFGSLFEVLDDTKTPMGTRLLKSWIVQPLLSKATIEQRQEIVQFFIENYDLRLTLRELLGQIGDLSRLISRINYSNTVNARNLLQIRNGLEIIKEIKEEFASYDNPLVTSIIAQLASFDHIIELVGKAIHEMPPNTITEGKIIKDGFNAQVDEYRDILQNGKSWILKFEASEKEKLGVSAGVKISYNRVIGYFIQITENAMKGITIPDDYIQRQSIKSGIRYETPRLKEMEAKILSADENVKDLEYELFQEIRAQVQAETLAIQQNADIVAELDVLSNFAENAQNYGYCKPKIESHTRLVIKEGRHAVVEQINTKERYVPNDSLLDTEKEQILIITGPNWSGKSTYLRQTALIVLMSQIGSYVPATSAEIGLVDRIFTRIGASDDLTRGQSTFMLEMNEMAHILNYTTNRSLIIIDELGRGTGTVDGESIAQAVLEYLHDYGVKTLFSTHFHQLINLDMPRVHNYHFKIIEKKDSRELVFLRQLTDGGTDKSYGIHVAEMAGLPARVIDRAFDLMEETFNGETPKNTPTRTKPTPESKGQKTLPIVKKQPEKSEVTSTSKKRKRVQTSLFPVKRYDDSELVILLRSLDLDHMTPIQAFEALIKLKRKLSSGD